MGRRQIVTVNQRGVRKKVVGREKGSRPHEKPPQAPEHVRGVSSIMNVPGSDLKTFLDEQLE